VVVLVILVGVLLSVVQSAPAFTTSDSGVGHNLHNNVRIVLDSPLNFLLIGPISVICDLTAVTVASEGFLDDNRLALLVMWILGGSVFSFLASFLVRLMRALEMGRFLGNQRRDAHGYSLYDHYTADSVHMNSASAEWLSASALKPLGIRSGTACTAACSLHWQLTNHNQMSSNGFLLMSASAYCCY